jgi:hypothetical protein
MKKMDTTARYQIQWYVGGSLAFADPAIYHDTDGLKKTYPITDFTLPLGDSTVRAVLLAQKTQSCPYYSGSLTSPPDSLIDSSNVLKLTVRPVYTPTVIGLSATQDGLCKTPFIDSIQFTANTDSLTHDAGSNPKFLWYLNGVPVTTGSVSLYPGTDSARTGTNTIISSGVDTSHFISNGGLYYGSDTIGVQIINRDSVCFSAGDTSAIFQLSLATFPIYPPVSAVAIATSTPPPFCQNNLLPVLLSATGQQNPGNKPTYWWVDSIDNKIVSDTSIYSYSNIRNGDTLSLFMKSSVACVLHDTVSSGLRVVVNNPLTPSLVITPDTTTICSGSNITFTLTPTNGGPSPIYTFYQLLNGSSNPVSANQIDATHYQISSITDGGQVYCVMLTSLPCVSITTANSDTTVVMKVNPIPSVNPITGDFSLCKGAYKIYSETTLGGIWSVSPSGVFNVDSLGLSNGIDSAKVTGLIEGSASVGYTPKYGLPRQCDFGYFSKFYLCSIRFIGKEKHLPW